MGSRLDIQYQQDHRKSTTDKCSYLLLPLILCSYYEMCDVAKVSDHVAPLVMYVYLSDVWAQL